MNEVLTLTATAPFSNGSLEREEREEEKQPVYICIAAFYAMLRELLAGKECLPKQFHHIVLCITSDNVIYLPNKVFRNLLQQPSLTTLEFDGQVKVDGTLKDSKLNDRAMNI